jgi:hypothetical protein
MRIGAALALIAVGAILRFALVTVATHGLYLHTIGDILMGVGVLGLILWLVVWAPWARNRSGYGRSRVVQDTRYQPGTPVPGTQVRQEEYRYEDQ